MERKEQEPRRLKTSYKYKLKKVKDAEKELEFVRNSSGTSIFYHRLASNILDLIMWGIIAFFVYGWWVTRGASTDCTITACQSLYPDICSSFGGILTNG